MDYLWAFVIGGGICVIGQLLISLTRLTAARILVIFVTAGVVLTALGLYEPLVEGIGSMDPAVLLPMVAGIAVVVLLTARMINFLFKRYYTTAYHAIIGIVIASTLLIIPLEYAGWQQILLSVLCCAGGFYGALKMEQYGRKIQ